MASAEPQLPPLPRTRPPSPSTVPAQLPQAPHGRPRTHTAAPGPGRPPQAPHGRPRTRTAAPGPARPPQALSVQPGACLASRYGINLPGGLSGSSLPWAGFVTPLGTWALPGSARGPRARRTELERTKQKYTLLPLQGRSRDILFSLSSILSCKAGPSAQAAPPPRE
uniref:Uncharacterized protein n=1 Tax=Myotis myotis TaxID=51298 RepID=A0A7J7QZ73_MYOMY|nr:hypothetical protein mMyoMyo1_011268 [Myotis myotis]